MRIPHLTLIVALFFGFSTLTLTQEQPPGITPSPESQALYRTMSAFRLINLACENAEQSRAIGYTSKRLMPTPDDVTVETVDVDDIAAAWFIPPDADESRVVFYLHGGAYNSGAIDDIYESLLARVALASGARALAINYRLAPENPYPAGLDDSLAAYRWLRQQFTGDIIIAGDSAGGGLALATVLALRDAGESLPAGMVLISPWLDLTHQGTTHAMMADFDPVLTTDALSSAAACYAGDEPLTNPLISPLFADLQGLPPLMIHAGTHEILLSDSTRMAQRAHEAGVEVTLAVWEGQVHDWPLFSATIPESQQALEQIGAFIRREN